MIREFIKTLDGSVTIHLPEMKESYHSKFGAIQEAYHVYIQNGLSQFLGQPVSILEIGFGTGLNAFITYIEAQKTNQEVRYTAIEGFPLTPAEVSHLNYVEHLNAVSQSSVFDILHTSVWEKEIIFNNDFILHKRRQMFEDIADKEMYNLIYFDAFGFHAQPHLWSTEIFKKMFDALISGGVLVTYACRTVIINAMKEAGFTVKKLPGPPGKREMLKATKL